MSTTISTPVEDICVSDSELMSNGKQLTLRHWVEPGARAHPWKQLHVGFPSDGDSSAAHVAVSTPQGVSCPTRSPVNTKTPTQHTHTHPASDMRKQCRRLPKKPIPLYAHQELLGFCLTICQFNGCYILILA